jgi:hypothetical protein
MEKAGGQPGFPLARLEAASLPLTSKRRHVYFTVSHPACQALVAPCDRIRRCAELGIAMTQSPKICDERAPSNDAPYTMVLFADPTTGQRVRRRITSALSHLPFEKSAPIRTFPTYRGRRAHQGRYWFSRSCSRVTFESRFEMAALRMLDFRGDIVEISSNPFWLLWPKGTGPKRHAPDFFARRRDNSVLVVDVKPQARVKDIDRAQHVRTREVCDQLGWSYEEFTTIDPVADQNLRLLAGYSRPRYAFSSDCTQTAARALETDADGRLRLADLLDAVLRNTGLDEATGLCGIYHMVWCGQLRIDLTQPLAWDSEVRR